MSQHNLNYTRPPKLTTAQRDALVSVQNGWSIYNTTANKYQIYTNGGWSEIASSVDYMFKTTDIAQYLGVASFSGQQFSSLIIAQASVTINYFYYYLSAKNATNPTVEVGIYNETGSTKIYSQTHTPTATGLQVVTLGTPQTLTKDTPYLLSILNQTGGDTTTTAPWSNNAGNQAMFARSSGRSVMASDISADTATGRTYWLAVGGSG